MNKLLVTLAAATVSLHAFAEPHGEMNPFAESAVMSVAGSVLSVALVASEVHALSIEPSEKASRAIGRLFENHPKWVVKSLTPEKAETKIELADADGKETMTVSVPNAALKDKNVQVGDTLKLHKLGATSFSAEHEGKPLVVFLLPDSGLQHSAPRK